MYVAAALGLSAATTAAMPYFQLGSIGPIQSFGIIVAAGVLIGAALLRRYAEWHGVSDDHIRALLGWVTICGFLGAHEFDMVAYNWDKIGEATNVVPPSWWFLPQNLYPSNWPLPLRLWEGISSYGGFLGGALGFAFYVWWKRLPGRLFADITIVGLLPAFSIGRIGCTVVSDHIGAAVDPNAWYSFLSMEYPREFEKANSGIAYLYKMHPGAGDSIPAWNLGFIELLYLIPVNAIILWMAFRPARSAGDGDKPKWIGRTQAGLLTALTGVLYAPVRFFLDYLRPENSDPRHFGFTFAQWASIAAFGGSVYLALRLFRSGKAEETISRTSREAQERLRMVLNEDEEEKVTGRKAAEKAAATPASKPEPKSDPKPEPKSEPKVEAKTEPPSGGGRVEIRIPASEVSEPFVREPYDDDDEDDDESVPPAKATGSTAQPARAPQKTGARPGGAKNKKKKRKR